MGDTQQILAGDVGGTKALLALFTFADGRLRIRAEENFSSPDYPGLEAILEEFLHRHSVQAPHACFGLPGPVIAGRVITPNLAWEAGVDARALAPVLRNVQISLLNDLEATGYGLRTLPPDQFLVLNSGRAQPQANAALIAAGTGLGEAILFWDGREHRPSASEGGHCDFAPRTLVEVEFFNYAFAQLGRISYDRVVSGSGLHLLYGFLRDTRREEEPAWLAEKLKTDDPAAVIAEAALT
ncbi:MAG: glucokinase, partial [Terriglobia bacterium]